MASENTTFSTSGEDAITRSIDVEVDQTAQSLGLEDFEDFYDVERTANEIINGDHKKVGLHIFNLKTNPDRFLLDCSSVS